MNAKKRQATFVLYGGIGLIALALVGLGAVVVLDEMEDKEKAEKSVKQWRGVSGATVWGGVARFF